MNKITISSKRKNEIKNIVLETLKNTDKLTIPVNIKHIVRQFENCKLIPYSTHMKYYNLTYQEMLEHAGTKDAYSDYHINKNKYIITYNDIDPIIVKSNRYRWNIAHELGHVLLGHHKNDKTRIFRNSLSDSEYNELEAEADYFAAYILFPHAVAIKLKPLNSSKYSNKSYDVISTIFKLSIKASKVRLHEYILWIHNKSYKEKYYSQTFALFKCAMYQKLCSVCNYYFVKNNAVYCPICGNKKLKWEEGKKTMIYNSSKFIRCTICENEEIDDNANYCKICGNDLKNYCTNSNCANSKNGLEKNSRYCYLCGSESLYYQNKLFNNWKNEFNSSNTQYKSNDIDDDDLPF